MSPNKASLIILGTITLTIVVALLVLGFVFASAPSRPETGQVFATRPAVTFLPTPTCTSTPVPPTPLPTTTPTVKVGEIIQQHSRCESDIILRRTDKASRLTLEEAMQAAVDRGWSRELAFGGIVNGKQVTVNGVFGLGTFGEAFDTSGYSMPPGVTPDPACINWVGPCNIHLEKCSAGKCIDTGEIINKIIDRPMWVLFYENIPYFGSGIPGKPMPDNAAAIVAVDDETGMILGITNCGWYDD